MIRKVFRILLLVLLFLTLLTGSFFLLVRLPSVQTFLAHRATSVISKSLGVKVSIDRVALSFFNKADLVNFYMEDKQHNTMLAAADLKIQFKVFSLLGKKISVTDVFFDGAKVYLHRDTAGNTNITDVLQSFKDTKPEVKKDAVNKPASFDWDIDLQNLVMQKTSFRYLDEKGHMDFQVKLPVCNISMKTLDLQKQIFAVNSIYIDKADVSFDQLINTVAGPVDTAVKDFHFLKGMPAVTFGQLKVNDSHFRMDDHNHDTVLPKGMDFRHLDLTSINLTAKDGKVMPDTIIANIKGLSVKDRSGFVLNNLATEARFTAKDITLDKLFLKTPATNLDGYLGFSYNSFADFGDFFNTVKLRAKLTDSKIALRDLNYFVKNLDKVEHNTFSINGELTGRINNLKGRGIEIRTGSSTIFKGDFYTRGLPNIYETSLNVRIDRLATTIQDVRRIYPGLTLPDNLNTLGLIYYVGDFDGFVTNFASKGRLVTSIGSATTDMQVKYDKDSNKVSYEGNVSLVEFNIGRYIGDERMIGKISLNTHVNGKGLTPESLDATLDGQVSSLTIKGYDYKNIKIDGVLEKKSFDGVLKIEDKNLAMDFDGRADLTNKVPEFRFKSNIRRANLKNLNLIKDSIDFSAKIESDFTGSKIDDLAGSIDVTDIAVSRDTFSAFVKHVGLSARFAGKKKQVILDSDVADAELDGNFTFNKLPGALEKMVDYTFTKDYVDTSTDKVPQDFTLEFTYYEQPGNLTQIILPQLRRLSSSRVTCAFNSINHKLSVTANIPEVAYGAMSIHDAIVSGKTDKGVFDFNTSIDRFYNNDSLLFDSISFGAKKDGKDIKFDLKGGDGKQYNYADISAVLTPEPGEALLRFEPGDVRLGNNNWHFEPNDSIFIQGKKITSRDLIFRSNSQTISITSYLKGDTSTSLNISFNNTSLYDFTSIFSSRVHDFKGVANGNLMVDDIFYTPHAYANIMVKDLTMGKILIGDVSVNTQLDSVAKSLILSATVKGVNTDLHASGYISIDPANPGLKIDVEESKVNLSFLNYRFFDKYVRDVRGYAIINASVTGTLAKPLLKGDVGLINDTVTVSFTNTTYTLNHQNAKLDDHGFNLDGIVIHDLKGNAAYGSGRINHESFKDFALDIKVTTEQAQFLNTTPQNSPGFYGVAYGKGAINFNGPINSPVITASATTGPGTYCKMPINSSYETNRYSFYKFVVKGKDNVAVSQPGSFRLNGITFNLNLEVTPDARMDIILDPITGDVLTGYGRGNLTIKIPKNSNMDLRGDYTIERGSYLFTLQNVITKHFDIDPGGTVSFNGDLSKARLNLSAIYKVRASVYDLISDLLGSSTSSASSVGFSSNAVATGAQRQSEIDLVLNLTDMLEKPTIEFDIRPVDVDPTVKTYVDQKLALLKLNETELNKQVFGLLVMNQFIPTSVSTQNAITNSNYISGTAANTVSEFISSQFSNYLSNLLEFANVRNLDVNLGLKQYDPSALSLPGSTSTSDQRTQVQLALTQRLLNNRLSINAGGNLDMGTSGTVTDPSGTYVTKSVVPTGDVQIEYALTADGVWRAKAFNRTNYDYLNERNDNRTGIGISYHQEFDKPSELFRKKKKPAKKDNEKNAGKNTPEVKPTGTSIPPKTAN